MNAFKKHTHGYRHVCKPCQYLAAMQNPGAKELKNARTRAYRASEKGKATEKTYAQSDSGKQSRKLAIKKYEQGVGKATKVARTIFRRLAKLQRTPAWLTDIDFERINNEYRVAALLTKVTGSPWHVDHIVPLQGKMVSGLHVPSNLRVLPATENIRKSNNYQEALCQLPKPCVTRSRFNS
jgi:hypothetical protein